MAERKKIVVTYLYSEVMPYAISVMRELVRVFGADVHCVYWDKKKGTPFIPENENGINFYRRSEYDEGSLTDLIEKQAPSIIYVSGTMDKLYLRLALHFRKKGVKLVSASDNKWLNTWKQRIQTIFSYTLFRKYFEYIWIPGSSQYAFARLMGYREDKIIKNLYSADTRPFSIAFENGRNNKKEKYPHTIVFVGRFTEVKGIDILLKAFAEAKSHADNDWNLVLVGSGNLVFESNPFVEVVDFLPNTKLAEKTREWGVFCLPSIREPWGVVVHEFAAAGFPLICSDCVGAGDAFIINGYNGFTFKTGDSDDLKRRLLEIMDCSDDQLRVMGERSRKLSESIDPVKSAYSLTGILS